ncbi:MAG: hypothetical protein AB8D78_11675 [Akkermansiaceae bacterium]
MSAQFIELPHTELTKLLGEESTDGDTLHHKVMDLIQGGEAKIHETCILVCSEGQTASLNSFLEDIYPSEYEPPGFGIPVDWELPNPANIIRAITTFEVRNTGITFEFSPVVLRNGEFVKVRLLSELDRRLRLDTWFEHRDRWGDASTTMPVYGRLRVNSEITLRADRFGLAAVLTPRQEKPAPAISKRLLVFLHAKVLEPSS